MSCALVAAAVVVVVMLLLPARLCLVVAVAVARHVRMSGMTLLILERLSPILSALAG